MGTIATFVEKTQEYVNLAGIAVGAENTIDFSVTNTATGDVVQAIKIPANAFVTRISVIVRTAEGGALTATVGDGTNASGWDASNVDFNAAAGTVTRSLEATDTYGIGKLYTAADTIDFTMTGAADAGKVTIVAEYTMIDR